MRNKSEKSRTLYFYILIPVIVAAFSCGIALYHHFRTTVNLDKLAEHLLSSSVYYQDMAEISRDGIAARYGIDASDIAESKAYAASDGTAREFVLLKAVSVEAAGDMMDALTGYSLGLMDRYSGKSNKEYERVKGYVISRTGEYVIFTISDENGTGSKAAKEYLDSTLYDQTR